MTAMPPTLAPVGAPVPDDEPDIELLDIDPQEWVRRQAAAARAITSRIPDPAAQRELFAMLGLPAADQLAVGAVA
jgi:hypothetical protein